MKLKNSILKQAWFVPFLNLQRTPQRVLSAPARDTRMSLRHHLSRLPFVWCSTGFLVSRAQP